MKLFLLVAALATVGVSAPAQDGADQSAQRSGPSEESQSTDDSGAADDLFSDPFAEAEGSDEEDDLSLDDLDSLFEDDDMIDEVEADGETAPETDLLVRENTRIGGRFSTSFESLSTWAEYPAWEDLATPSQALLVPTIAARIFVDARPEDDFRFYARFDLDYPFSVEANGADGGEVAVPSIEVFELFSDFSWNETLFFRIGKSVVNWGVGYFFSPADVISLTPIDPEDPEVDREGPVSFRTHLPFDVHNAYFYVVAGETIADDGEIDVVELTVAPKLELFFAGVEYGLGAFYQKDLSPRAMATISTSIWDFDLFGEGVVSYGSDRVFIRETDDPFVPWETYTDDESLFFQGTGGFRYSNTDLDASVIAQYYYNGEGYTDPELIGHALGTVVLVETGLLPAATIDESGGDIGVADLTRASPHYATVVASLSEVFGTDLSAGLLWQGNLSDGSGLVAPSLTYRLFERGSITAQTTIAYGPDDREFTNLGARMSASLSVSLGSGSF
jgi:hypothetical protein